MRRHTKPAVVLTTLAALTLSAFGAGAADAAGTAGGTTDSGSTSRATADSRGTTGPPG
jgi:hypothetical protein